MDFRDRLFDLRRQAGLSQEELANLLGLTRQAVQKWEAGTSRPDMDNLVALANYFHVSLDYLVTDRENAGTLSSPESGPANPSQPVTTVIHHHYHDTWHYEYKSQCTLFGLPLVHINFRSHGARWARGIIAVGNFATGVVSLGGLSLGVFSLGGISIGLLALGGLALGGLSLGGVSVGILSLGACAIGHYAAGATAVGSALAVGVAAVSPGVEVGLDTSGRAALSPTGRPPASSSRMYRQA